MLIYGGQDPQFKDATTTFVTATADIDNRIRKLMVCTLDVCDSCHVRTG